MYKIKYKILYSFFIAAFILQYNSFCNGSPESVDKIQDAKNITLVVEDMDILSVLNIISVKSGFNIVMGKNVTGKVTIFLRNVNALDALEIILLANNLAYDRQGDIINVMTDREYELIYGEKFSDKRKIYIMKLKHSKAANVSKVLSQAKTDIGKVIVDEDSNTIILIDTPPSIIQMEKILEEIDGSGVIKKKTDAVKNVKKEEVFDQLKKLSDLANAQKAALANVLNIIPVDKYYFTNMKKKIQDTARSNFSHIQLKGDCAVKFSLDSSGSLVGEPIIISEDSKLVGDVIIESVKLASPFGKFPEEFDAQGENFTINVSFQP